MFSKKGYLSHQILVAIFIGIFVMAVIIYLMFFYSGESFDCHLCSAKFSEWCQRCLIEGENWNKTMHGDDWVDIVEMDDYLIDCKEGCLGISIEHCTEAEERCRQFIYIPFVTTTV